MKILFVSHDASRSGAPILLLNFIRWFKENSAVPFLIMLKKGGPLRADFEQLGRTYLYNDDDGKQKSLLRRLGDKLMPGKCDNDKRNSYLNLFKREQIGLVYVNTATNGDLYDLLHELHCPIVTHVHELERSIRMYAGKENIDRVKRFTDHYIVVSEAVKSNLVTLHDIPEDRLTVCHAFISVCDIINGSYSKEGVCAEINIPVNSFIVCGSGWTNWFKSPDIFVQLAKAVIKKIPLEPVYFMWVGDFSYFSHDYLQHDIDNLGLKGRVLFLGKKTDPWDYFASCNIFALVSREDSFPLVCLEAAALAKPITCFEKSGGMPEFVEDDAGLVAPYLDISTMAQFIINMYFDKAVCNRYGSAARNKVLARHSIEQSAPIILNIIYNMMNKRDAQGLLTVRSK
jgi:glycosyltransferase involved in cell wall biosynthesis